MSRYSTFEVRQGDDFVEDLILEDTENGVAANLTETTIEAFLLRPGEESYKFNVQMTSPTEGMFTITAPNTDTATWQPDNYDGYIVLVEAGIRTSSENFTVTVIEGAVDV